MKIWDEIMNLVYPDDIYCIGCGAIIEEKRPYNLCGKCISHFHFATGRTCAKCGRVLSDDYDRLLCNSCIEAAAEFADPESGEIDGSRADYCDGHNFDRGFTCMMYGMYEKEMIKAFKYHGRAYYARAFGEMMYDRISQEELETDMVVPVPLHRRKLHKRGYNQAALLASEVARYLNIPMADVLVRTEYTEPMSRLTGAERGMNLVRHGSGESDNEETVFAVKPSKRCNLNGKRILLIDDIYTTGATVDACAAELKKHGAVQVFVLTLASAGNPPPMEYDT